MEASGTRRWRRCGKVQGDGAAAGIDGEQAGRDEVGAAGVAELDFGCDGVVAEGPEQVDAEGELSTQAGVARGDEAAEAPSWTSCQVHGGRWGVGQRGGEGSAEVVAWPRVASTRREPVSAGWCRCGRGALRDGGATGAAQAARGEVGVGEREGSFDLVELEVQARAGGLDVGEAGRGADELLGCGRAFAWVREA